MTTDICKMLSSNKGEMAVDFDVEKYILRTEKDPHSWSFYKSQEANDWSAEEFDFTKDAQQYRESSVNIQNLLDRIITFFIFADGMIAEEVITEIQSSIKQKNWPKVFWLSIKLKIENTHAETYVKAFFTIIPEHKHLILIKEAQTLPCMKRKSKFIHDSIMTKESEGLQDIKDAASEGIFFVSQFALIFYLRKLGLFDNFIESNEQISGDETLHRDKAAEDAAENLTSEDIPKAIEILKEAVDIEKEFISFLLKDFIMSEQSDKDSGLTIDNMYRYIENLADEICMIAEMEPIYNNQEDINLKWMEDINMSQKINFYERLTNTSYRRFKKGGGNDKMTFDNPDDVIF